MINVLLLLAVFGIANAGETPELHGPSLIGIDHMPIVVADLEEAVVSYQHLGFSIKPGRFHANGLRNSHVKFNDGSGIELISPPSQPADELTRTYTELLKGSEGPAYISFHARDTDALIAALNSANIAFKGNNGLVTLSDPNLQFVFFVRDNRSPTDKPEHFAHPNTAVAMTEVWLALDAPGQASLRTLLLALGAIESNETVLTPTEASAEVFTIQNGRVVVLPETRQLQNGRPVIGATFAVRKLQVAHNFLETTDDLVATPGAHGLWLQFADFAAMLDSTELPDVALPPELDRVLRDYEQAWRAGDPAALASLFAEDGYVLQSGRPPIRGRLAIQAAYEGQGGGPLNLRALDFATGDEVGYIIGVYSYDGIPGDMGKFTLTLRRTPGEPWLIFSDMDNANTAH